MLITGAGCGSTTTGGVGAAGSAMVLKTPIELVVRLVPSSQAITCNPKGWADGSKPAAFREEFP
jgi:hypothetical protein